MLKLVLSLVILVTASHASTVANDTVTTFAGPFRGLGNTYLLSATGCFDPFCSDPPIGPISYQFSFFDPLGPLISTTVPVFLNLQGSGPPNEQIRLLAGMSVPGSAFDQTIVADGNGCLSFTAILAPNTVIGDLSSPILVPPHNSSRALSSEVRVIGWLREGSANPCRARRRR